MKQINISVNALSQLSCARLYQFRSVMRLAISDEVFKWGTAIHEYREAIDKNKPEPILSIAMRHGIKDPGAIYAASLSLDQQAFPPICRDVNNTPMSEWQFGFPYKTINDKYQINLRGIIDRIDIVQGAVRVLDYKSTRKADKSAALAEWGSQLQLPFYIFVLTKFLCHLLPDELAAKVSAGKIFGQHLGIFLSAKPPCVGLSSGVSVTPDTFDEIEWLLDDLILKTCAIHELGDRLAYPEGSAYGLCHKCNFLPICLIKNKDKQQETITNYARSN